MDMGEVKTKCYHWNDLSCLIKAILGLYFESECTQFVNRVAKVGGWQSCFQECFLFSCYTQFNKVVHTLEQTTQCCHVATWRTRVII